MALQIKVRREQHRERHRHNIENGVAQEQREPSSSMKPTSSKADPFVPPLLLPPPPPPPPPFVPPLLFCLQQNNEQLQPPLSSTTLPNPFVGQHQLLAQLYQEARFRQQQQELQNAQQLQQLALQLMVELQRASFTAPTTSNGTNGSSIDKINFHETEKIRLDLLEQLIQNSMYFNISKS